LYALYQTSAQPLETGRNLEDFAQQAMRATVQDLDSAGIEAAVQEACFQSCVWLSVGNATHAKGLDLFAHRLWLAYGAIHPNRAAASTGLAEFDRLCAAARERALFELGEPFKTRLRQTPPSL